MTQSLWTALEAEKATKGQLSSGQNWQAMGISIDTRSLKPKDLFIALKDRRDGHEFVRQAFQKGACAALTEKPCPDGPCLIVDNTQLGLRALGKAGRDRSTALRIAVTGSVGKTSIKEMLGSVFRQKGETHLSARSFNNHIGVPITLASLPDQAEYGIFELGMNHLGEIEDLSKQVQPVVSLISKIAPAHLGNFASLDQIVQAKSEIFSGQKPGQMTVLNADQPFFVRLQEKARQNGLNIISFGTHQTADVRLIDFSQSINGISGGISYQGETERFDLAVSGAHFAENANAVFAVALACGLSLTDISEGLKQFNPVDGRGGVHVFRLNGKSFRVIDESYNANPVSMRAALQLLADYADHQSTNPRKLAILGDMLELGAHSEKSHKALLADIEQADPDHIILFGKEMEALWPLLADRKKLAKTVSIEHTCQILKEEIKDNDLLLIKGSNSLGLGQIVHWLKQNYHKTGSAGQKDVNYVV